MSADARVVAAIDDIFGDWTKPNLPGGAVGVVSDGEAVYTKAFGLANVEHGVPNTTSTVFDIGSVTKQFTAFAVLMLVCEGKLRLDDEVRRYVTGLPDHDPPIRVRHCLYHTSGLTDWIFALELTGPIGDHISEKRAYRTVAGLSETLFPAGREHSYSNTGYVLLAWIVRQVSGRPLHGFLEERVFEPLGMSSAAFLTSSGNFLPDQAQGYWRDRDGILYRMSGSCDVHGDGMMHASASDMVCWLRNLKTRTVGGAGLFDRFLAPGHLDDGRSLRYAAGWELDRYRGLHAVRHGGMSSGFQSHIAWFPELDVGVVILGNFRPYLPWVMANGVLDALIGPRDASRQSPSPQMHSGEGAASSSDDVTGRYFTATGLPVLIDRHGEKLRIDIWFWCRPFIKQSDDRYVEQDSGDVVAFHRNAAGDVTHFSMETSDGACPRMHSPIRAAVKYDDASLGRPELDRYQGRYISDELDTVYTMVAEDDGLRARHMRCHDWHLRPIKSRITGAFDDDFAQEKEWPGKVTFERNSAGGIVGFRVRGTGVNLYFRKLISASGQTA